MCSLRGTGHPDRFSGAGEALARRTGSGSGRNGEPTKHRTLLDSLMSSKAVRSRCIILKLQSIPSVITKSLLSCNAFCRPLIQIKQGRHHCRGTGARQDGLLFRRANRIVEIPVTPIAQAAYSQVAAAGHPLPKGRFSRPELS